MPGGDSMINPVTVQPATTPATAPSALPPVQKGPGKFSRIFGGILSGALNIVAPGAGSIISRFIGGNSSEANFASMQAMLQQQQQDSMRMVAFQSQVQQQTQEFTTVSNLLKVKHDGDMAAVNNLKS